MEMLLRRFWRPREVAVDVSCIGYEWQALVV